MLPFRQPARDPVVTRPIFNVSVDQIMTAACKLRGYVWRKVEGHNLSLMHCRVKEPMAIVVCPCGGNPGANDEEIMFCSMCLFWMGRLIIAIFGKNVPCASLQSAEATAHLRRSPILPPDLYPYLDQLIRAALFVQTSNLVEPLNTATDAVTERFARYADLHASHTLLSTLISSLCTPDAATLAIAYKSANRLALIAAVIVPRNEAIDCDSADAVIAPVVIAADDVDTSDECDAESEAENHDFDGVSH